MEKTEAMAKLNKEDGWETIEAVKDKKGNRYPVKLHNVIFKKGELCVLRLAVAGHGIDLFINPLEDGTLDFAVNCIMGEDGWFSSKDLAECINFMKTWFTEHKSVNE